MHCGGEPLERLHSIDSFWVILAALPPKSPKKTSWGGESAPNSTFLVLECKLH
jgi:hypothetical protein